MADFVRFLGRFHVLLVHLPIGILVLAAGLELLRRHRRFAGLDGVLPLIWLSGAVSGVLTLIVGYMHATEGGFDGAALDLHRWNASALVLAAFAMWAMRTEAPRLYARAWAPGVAVVALLLTTTGHYGGNLTHGPTYLAEYAPGPLKAWMGAPTELTARPKPASLSEADIYLDVVAPALRSRCGSCHNEARRRGDLSLVTYEGILEGGEGGPAIAPGTPEASDLIRRINLDESDVDYMPKNGKPPLSADEAAFIAWWISVGAPSEGTLAAFDPPQVVREAASRVLMLDEAAPERSVSR